MKLLSYASLVIASLILITGCNPDPEHGERDVVHRVTIGEQEFCIPAGYLWKGDDTNSSSVYLLAMYPDMSYAQESPQDL